MVSAWPDVSEYDLPDVAPWDRQAGEPSKAHAAFRIYRDLPPTQRRLVTVAEQSGYSERSCRVFASRWSWPERAAEWDDACHRVEDQERLEAIRSMHATHRRAGRMAIMKAIQALSQLNPEQMTPSTIARLMELGAKLERSTLIVSVEELQGLELEPDTDAEDPWERIAAELNPANVSLDLSDL